MGKDNKTINMLKSLKQKKFRDSTGLFLIEGEKFINEIPKNKYVEKYFVSQSYAERNPGFERAEAPVTVLSDGIFKSVSENKSPQGRIALCRKAQYTLEGLLNDISNSLFIIAEELNDPGNLGTIIRTAYAADASGVLLSKGSVELYNPKTLKSAAGAVFHVPVVENLDLAVILPQIVSKGISVTASCASGGKLLYDLDFTKPSAIIIGNEARGLSEGVLRFADSIVRIPMPGGAESLNASVACAVLIYEAVRQRHNRTCAGERTCRTCD